MANGLLNQIYAPSNRQLIEEEQRRNPLFGLLRQQQAPQQHQAVPAKTLGENILQRVKNVAPRTMAQIKGGAELLGTAPKRSVIPKRGVPTPPFYDAGRTVLRNVAGLLGIAGAGVAGPIEALVEEPVSDQLQLKGKLSKGQADLAAMAATGLLPFAMGTKAASGMSRIPQRKGVDSDELVVPGVSRGDEMVVTHNLSPENLAHAEKVGGLPMPSLGVAKTGQPIEGYGDIVLIGDKQMAKSSARNPVAPADSYTVTYPEVLKEINKDSEADALELFAAPIREIDPKLADEVLSKPWELYNDIGEMRHYWPARALYLKDIGREDVLRKALKRYQKEKESMSRVGRDRGYVLSQEISDADLDQGWYRYSDNLVDRLRQSGVRVDESIFKGYTQLGNRRYAAHTLDNVMKEMRQRSKDIYANTVLGGMGAMRARLAPRFKNLKAVVEGRDRLVDQKTFRAVRDELNDAFFSLSEKLAKHRKGYKPNRLEMLDRVSEDVIDYGLRGRRGLEDFYDDVPDELLKEMDELITAIKKMPTEYFEIKPKRIMQVNEFSGALVPDNASKDVIERLNRMGITRIEKYSKPSMTSEEQALFPSSDLNVGSGKSKALDNFKDLMFGAAPLGLIGLEEDQKGLLQ